MIIFPAIDVVDGKAVRLLKGDYNKMTVYSENPVAVALDFKKAGATSIHLVDLEGAKSGDTPNLETIVAIKKESLICFSRSFLSNSLSTIALYSSYWSNIEVSKCFILIPIFLRSSM